MYLSTLTGTKNCVYNVLGNPNSYLGNSLVWSRGSLLAQFGSYSFNYNADGQRFNKVLNQNNTFTYYYYSEGRLTAEERRINNVNNTIKYLYNATGICGFTLVNPIIILCITILKTFLVTLRIFVTT